MNELFEKQGQSIHTFKRGEIIVRLKPAVYTQTRLNENLGISIEVPIRTDNSYREPVEFVCVENNLIYLRSMTKNWQGIHRVSSVELEVWSEDWALFIVPEGVTMEDCI